MTDLSFDAGMVGGLLFSITRVVGLILGAPQLGRRVPMVGRSALVLSIGWFLASPVPESFLTLGGIFSGVLVNLTIGLVLGFITTLIFQIFSTAGGVIDISSGLGISAVFDPQSGIQVTVFERFFDLTALTLFFIMGGPRLLVAGLAGTIEAVPLDGSISLQANLADVAVDALSRFFLAGLEIAMPALAALFLAELVLGVAARMLPEANIFLLGLPAKLGIVFVAVGVVILSFPVVTRAGLTEMQHLMIVVTGSLG